MIKFCVCYGIKHFLCGNEKSLFSKGREWVVNVRIYVGIARILFVLSY